MALFCCGSERTLYGKTAAEEIGVRPIPVCLWGTKKMDCIFDRWIRTPEEIHAPILQVKDALSGNSFAAFAHKYSAQK